MCIAQRFCTDDPDNEHLSPNSESVLFRFHLPLRAIALDIESISIYMEEGETLLFPYQYFMVKDYTPVPDFSCRGMIDIEWLEGDHTMQESDVPQFSPPSPNHYAISTALIGGGCARKVKNSVLSRFSWAKSQSEPDYCVGEESVVGPLPSFKSWKSDDSIADSDAESLFSARSSKSEDAFDIDFALAVRNRECARIIALEKDSEISDRWDSHSFVSAASSDVWGDDGM